MEGRQRGAESRTDVGEKVRRECRIPDPFGIDSVIDQIVERDFEVIGHAFEHFDPRPGARFALVEHGTLRKLERIEQLLEGVTADRGELFDPAEPEVRRVQARALRKPSMETCPEGFEAAGVRSPFTTAFAYGRGPHAESSEFGP